MHRWAFTRFLKDGFSRRVSPRALINLLANDENRPPDTNVWHTDVTFRPNPPFASILYSKIIKSKKTDNVAKIS